MDPFRDIANNLINSLVWKIPVMTHIERTLSQERRGFSALWEQVDSMKKMKESDIQNGHTSSMVLSYVCFGRLSNHIYTFRWEQYLHFIAVNQNVPKAFNTQFPLKTLVLFRASHAVDTILSVVIRICS